MVESDEEESLHTDTGQVLPYLPSPLIEEVNTYAVTVTLFTHVRKCAPMKFHSNHYSGLSVCV